MWTPEQDGHEPDPKLIEEVTWRCYRLLKTARKVKHGDYGSHGVIYRRRVTLGEVEIERLGSDGIRVEFGIGDGSTGRRAFREARGLADGYIDEELVRNHLLPYLRRAMILDDIANGAAEDE